MADSVPAVGSLISLISRTGIRYQGSMYTVDLNDSTIALSHGKTERERQAARRWSSARARSRVKAKTLLMTSDPNVATAKAAA